MTALAITLWVVCLALCALGLSRLRLRLLPDTSKPVPLFPVKHDTSEETSLCQPVLSNNLQTLFWQVIEARKGIALAGQSQVLILAKVPLTSFLSLPASLTEDPLQHALADILIVDTHFRPLLVLSAAPAFSNSLERILRSAHIGFIHVPASISSEELMPMLYNMLAQYPGEQLVS